MVGRGFDVGGIALWSKFLAFRCRFLLKLTIYWGREQSGQLSLSHSLSITVSSSLHLMVPMGHTICSTQSIPFIVNYTHIADEAIHHLFLPQQQKHHQHMFVARLGDSLKGPWRAYVYVKYEYLECGRVWFHWTGLTFKCQPESSFLPPQGRDLVSHTKLEFLSIFW